MHGITRNAIIAAHVHDQNCHKTAKCQVCIQGHIAVQGVWTTLSYEHSGLRDFTNSIRRSACRSFVLEWQGRFWHLQFWGEGGRGARASGGDRPPEKNFGRMIKYPVCDIKPTCNH